VSVGATSSKLSHVSVEGAYEVCHACTLVVEDGGGEGEGGKVAAEAQHELAHDRPPRLGGAGGGGERELVQGW
jgi:hypothetical protein